MQLRSIRRRRLVPGGSLRRMHAAMGMAPALGAAFFSLFLGAASVGAPAEAGVVGHDADFSVSTLWSSGGYCGSGGYSSGGYDCGGYTFSGGYCNVGGYNYGGGSCNYGGSYSGCGTYNYGCGGYSYGGGCSYGGGSYGGWGCSYNGVIVGQVVCDTTGCGVPQSCDTGIQGVCVTLKNSQGCVIATTTTDCNGYYSFCGLAPCNYNVYIPQTYCGETACSYNPCVTVTDCGWTCKSFCYQCKPVNSSMTVTETATCTTAGKATFSDVVKNTGSDTLTNITVKDSAGNTVGTIASLTAGSSATVSETVALTGTVTLTATATGTDSIGKTITASSSATSITAMQPAISLSLTTSKPNAQPGDTVSLSYTIKNTGNDTLSNVVLTDANGATHTIASLASGASQTVSGISYTIPTNTPTGSLSIGGSVTGTDACNITVSSTATTPETIVASALSVTASSTCTMSNNTPVYTFSATVKNTGTDTITGITVKDSLGNTVGTIASLASGASSSVSETLTLTQTTSVSATATGTDTASDTVTASSSATSIMVMQPGISLSVSASPTTASPGDTIALTYTIKNTGNDTLSNITLVDSNKNVLGLIATLDSGKSQQLTINYPIPANTQPGSLTLGGSVSGTDACNITVNASTSLNENIVAPATITGTVGCSDNPSGEPISGATVALLDANNNVIATTTTNSSGAYSFPGAPDGNYSISVTDAPDWMPNSSSSFSYSHTGSNLVVPAIGLTVEPIGYQSNQVIDGNVYFGNSAYFVNAAAGQSAIQQSDLFTSTYVSSNESVAHPYVGTIPDFPELGTFGTGPNDQHIYVIVQQQLLPTNVYDGYTFTNSIGVRDVNNTITGGTEGVSGQYIYRFLFNQPFTGPGTAHNYHFTGLESSYTLPVPAVITQLPSIWVGAGAAPSTPALSDVPAGFMAQAVVQINLPAGAYSENYVDGAYDDACGNIFTFHLHPFVGYGE